MKNPVVLFLAGMLILAASARAQLPVDGIHYPVGLAGIKGGTLPGPGFYFQDDNLFYTGSDNLGGQNNYKTFIYLQAPHLLWVTDWKVLGADYGLGVRVPFGYKEVSYYTPIRSAGGRIVNVVTDANRFGLGDVEVEPVLLSWHLEQFDFLVGYGLWLPTGEFDANSSVNLGNDRWAHQLTCGGVWYPDQDRAWAISVLNRLEFNSQTLRSFSTLLPNGTTTSSPVFASCSVYSLEWGLSRTVSKNTDLGLVGYFQKQFVEAGYTPEGASVAGVGPELRTEIPRWDLTASLRCICEFLADNRPQGYTVALTLTKRF